VFNIDQYTDVTCITKPVIYISISEIVDMHKVKKHLLLPVSGNTHHISEIVEMHKVKHLLLPVSGNTRHISEIIDMHKVKQLLLPV